MWTITSRFFHQYKVFKAHSYYGVHYSFFFFFFNDQIVLHCTDLSLFKTKTIPKKKKSKSKKAKWLSEEALQIYVKRGEAKSKGEEERYTHLNAKFQRIARRDKEAFLSDQCKEIEENNRMGKTRDYCISPQENKRYQGNISFKNEHNKGQKW